MAERMLALRTPARVRSRTDALEASDATPSGLDRATRDALLRFLRGELPPAPHVLAAAHRGLCNPALVGRLVAAHRAGAPLGRNVDRKIVDPFALLTDPAFDLSPQENAEETKALTVVAEQLGIAIASCREGHLRLAAIRHHSPVGAVSECAESVAEVAVAAWAIVARKKRATHADWSVALPPLAIWDPVLRVTSDACDALRAGYPRVAREMLVSATQGFARNHRRFMEYRERTEAGASGVATTLHIVQTTCESLVAGLAATVAAPLGVLAAAVVAAVAGGSAVLVDGAASQVTEHELGLRREYELQRLLGDAGQAALSNFISSLGAGLLAKPFESVLGNILKNRIPPELWLHVMGDAETITAQQALAYFSRWKPLLELCGTEAATLLAGVVDGLLARWRSERRHDPHVASVMQTLEDDLVANGLAQLVISALTRHAVGRAA